MKKSVILFSLLFCTLFTLSAQKIKLNGSVVDEKGNGLPGASVIVKGESSGMITDLNGEFKIDVKRGSTLVCRFIGYLPKETVVTEPSIKITLIEDVKVLEDVVVIGYGTVNRRDLTGSVVSVGKENLEKKMTSNVLDALQGSAAGVSVTSSSGEPGASATIRIRGLSTFGDGVEPLYVVDGVQMDDIKTINPNDIESIDILKDAASASIYGARSANGVVIITTKQGIPKKPAINFSFSHSIGKLTHTMEQMSPRDQLNFYKKAQAYLLTQDGLNINNKMLLPNVIHRYDPLVNDSLNFMQGANHDYQKELFNIAQRDILNANLSGGSDLFKYFTSVGFLNETGIIPNTGLTRITTRLNSNFSLTNKIVSRNSISFSVQNKKGVDEYGYLNSLLGRQPNAPYKYPEGELLGYIGNVGRNPYSYPLSKNSNQNYKASLNQSIYYTVSNYLKFNTSLNAEITVDRYQQMTPSFITDPNQLKNSGYSISHIYTNWLWNTNVNYNRKFAQNHTINGLLGYEMSYNSWEQDRITGQDSPSDVLYTMNAFSANFNLPLTFTDINKSTMVSSFGRATYSYKSRYILNATVRVDRSSRFAKENSTGVFPSASFAWRFSDESFFKWATRKSLLNDAKVRLSYGITGNDRIGNYESFATYETSIPYDGQSTIVPSTIESNGLGWEQTRQFNVGADIALLPKSKVTITLDYYNKMTDRLLAWIDLPKEVGFAAVRKNIGSVKNTGFEATISAMLITGRDFSLKVSGNISFNENKIISLAQHVPVYQSISNVSGSSYILTEGGSIGDFYGFENFGVFQYDESNAFSADWKQLTPNFDTDINGNRVLLGYTLNGNEYSDEIYKKTLPDETPFRGGDFNWGLEEGNTTGIVDYNLSRKIIGNALPLFYGGFNTTITYKKFDLFFVFNYSVGGKIYNYAKQSQDFGFATSAYTTTKDFLNNSWTNPGDLTKYPRIFSSDLWQNDRTLNSMYLEDATFVRLGNLKLTYTFTNKKSKTKLTYSAYGYVNNALLWTAYSGFDPEFTSGSLTPNMDKNTYPRKREFGFGIDMKF